MSPACSTSLTWLPCHVERKSAPNAATVSLKWVMTDASSDCYLAATVSSARSNRPRVPVRSPQTDGATIPARSCRILPISFSSGYRRECPTQGTSCWSPPPANSLSGCRCPTACTCAHGFYLVSTELPCTRVLRPMTNKFLCVVWYSDRYRVTPVSILRILDSLSLASPAYYCQRHKVVRAAPPLIHAALGLEHWHLCYYGCWGWGLAF